MIENPTTAQQKAIETWDENIIVSAAAGSGKTAVMVDRAVQLILNGADIKNMLMVTFTNAAAAEMKLRIKKELMQLCFLDTLSQEQLQRIRSAADLVHSADISTMHSFCNRITRQYFNIAGVDPLFAVASDVEQTVLKMQALEEVANTYYQSENQAFFDMLTALFSGREQQMLDHVLVLHDFSRTLADPDSWLTTASYLYQPEGQAMLYQKEEEFIKATLSTMVQNLSGAIDTLARCATIFEAQDEQRLLKNAHSTMQNLEKTISIFKALQKEAFTPACNKELSSIRLPNPDTASFLKDYPEAQKNEVATFLYAVRKQLPVLKQHPFFSYEREDLKKWDEKSAQDIDTLCTMTQDFSKVYEALKKERGVIDHADAEHFALQILSDEKARQTLHEKYRYIFVDEYQDTNPLQESLIQALLGQNSNLFCVGDIKQSIYAFRHAVPALFLKRYDAFQAEEGGIAIDLAHNFRSSEPVIDAVNSVFAKAMNKKVGGVEYQKGHTLIGGLQKQKGSAQLHLILDDHSEADEEKEQAGKIMAEAILIASKIQDYIEEGYAYGDMAILLRSQKNRGQRIIDTLNSLNIPAGGNIDVDFYSQSEICATFSILNAINNSMDDYVLLGAMRSFAGNFSAKELADIRIHTPQSSYYQAVKSYIENGQDAQLKQKTETFLKQLTLWRNQALYQDIDSLLSDILLSTGAIAAYGMGENGKQRMKNLQTLQQRAKEFSEYGDGSLYGFLQMIEKNKQSGRATETAPLEENSVQVMTVHAAKGLEFPIVFFANANSRFNISDTTGMMQSIHEGIGVKHYIAQERARAESVQRFSMVQAKRPEMLGEELRILYVALTRAKEHLIVTATVNSNKLHSLGTTLTEDATSPLDWIAPSALENVEIGALETPEGQVKNGVWQTETHAIPTRVQSFQREEKENWEDFLNLATEADNAWVEKRLSYVYPFAASLAVPGKLTASTVGKKEIDLSLDKPAFVAETTGFSAAERGTFAHDAMQHMDWGKNAKPIEAQLLSMQERGIFTKQQKEAIDISMLEAFSKSPLAKRMMASDNLQREIPFNLLVPASFAGYDGEEKTLVQGIIDCAFLEEGAWVLVDYKTDRIPAGGKEQLLQRYKNQLKIYRMALEQITQKSVKETYLYLLSIGEQLEFLEETDEIE